ncbi:pleckstrin domain-containing protein [Heterostelium album PN500]|uniref:Pleckstrin domain-containing protein n=1 Tax=Heterostelium pallidum (strain ATCC 26659 / Pp 5 / PN500) TaxID=670386 RepID=D3BKY5_HETP5|nr:pleckstrin domain-containing protein [Heterostelium album PN500]EFA78565.1 pleckstrin domain-containing protein [Heterostelium album PN500]|eukprot:XP_020430689.1 pleckstrin domain-containing protein [Heterostelium album PN500]
MSEPPQKKILKVFDQDGLYKTMVVEPKTTAGEVCEKLGKKLFMKDGEMELFNLFVIEGGVKQSLKMTDFPFDTILKFEKKEYKFYFLNIKGEFMSFQERVASSLTAAATGKPAGGATSPSLTGNAPPSGSPAGASPKMSASSIKPGRGMSGYLLRKKAGKFFKVWCVANQTTLCFYASEEDKEPQMELVLENAIIELKANEQGAHILLTLSNSERHTLMAENQGDLQAWATELAATAAYSTVTQRAVATPSMAFVPTTKDLGHIKLQGKLENIDTQSTVLNRWTEYLVARRVGVAHSSDISNCYSDGCVLINVVDALFERQVKFRKGKSVYEMQHNIENVLEMLKSLGADYGKLLATDIVDCKVPRVILRLLYSIFIAFVTNGEKEYAAKDKLIGWCGRKTLEVNKSIIVDSPTALFNPLAFAALIARHNPNIIDMDSLSRKSKVDQAQVVLDVAYEHLKIPKILTANCWSEDHADERSFLVYLSFYYFYLGGDSSNKSQLLSRCLEEQQAVESESIVSARDKQLKAMVEKDEENRASPQTKPISTPSPQPVASKPPASKPMAKPIAKPMATATSAPSENGVTAKPMAKPMARPMAKPIAKPMATAPSENGVTAKPSPVPRTKPAPVPRSPALQEEKDKQEKQDSEKQAREKARKEAEEKADRLARQLELEMLENEMDDTNELLAEQRRIEQEDAAEMAELEELERLQREEFEREEAAKRFQQHFDQQRQDREREEKQRLEREKEKEKERERAKEQERAREQEREKEKEREREQERAREKRRIQEEEESQKDQTHQDILDTLAGIDDELDQILRREQEESKRFIEMMEKQTGMSISNDIKFEDSAHDSNQQNSKPQYEDEPPALGSVPPTRKESTNKQLNERASIINVFDKLDEELSHSRNNSISQPTRQQQPQQQQQYSNPSSKSGSVSSPPTTPRVTESDNTTVQKTSVSETTPPSQQNFTQPPSSAPPQPNQQQQQQQQEAPPDNRGKVVVRICLEGFGDVLFCSFAIGYDTLCGKVRQMVCKKMKVAMEFEQEYCLYIVRDGLERVLDDDEILLEAEDKIDRFVFKLSDNFDRKSIISNHRG